MNFFRRHKNKLLAFGAVSAIGASGLYLLNKYVEYKIAEQKAAEREEKLRQIQRQQQFEHTQGIAEKTLRNALLPELKQILSQCFDSKSVLSQLQQDSANVQLWQQLKFVVFGKCSALIICSSLAEMMVKIQLHILAGYNVQNNNNPLSIKLQETFMNLSHLFITQKIQKWIPEAFEPFLHSILDQYEDLSEGFNLTKIQELFQDICQKAEIKPIEFLLCVDDLKWGQLTKDEDRVLKALIMDLMDVLEYKDFNSVLLSSFFSMVVDILDKLAEEFPSRDIIAQNGLPLAKIIPKLDKVFNAKVVIHFGKNSRLKTLEANIFETFCLSTSCDLA